MAQCLIHRAGKAAFAGRSQRSSAARRQNARRALLACNAHKICVLSGDGIGPEITAATVQALTAAGKAEGAEFEYNYALIGGAAIDATGVPLPAETLAAAKASDSVLLAAIGGYAVAAACHRHTRARTQALRPEKGLLALRAGLNAFANLRPATVTPQVMMVQVLKVDEPRIHQESGNH
jgi:3-isopropylmalate dehydrogenase